MDYYCTDCGEYTTHRLFGQALCKECHARQDEEVEAVERRQAEKLGYRYGWSDN